MKQVDKSIEVISEQQIESGGLSRLYGLMEKGRVGFVTAFRSERSFEENQKLNMELRNNIRAYGFGYVPIIGEWEVEGNPIEYDRSYAIANPRLGKEEFVQACASLVKPYGQDSVMVVENLMAEFYDPKVSPPKLMGSAEKFKTASLDEWMGGDEGSRYRGKSTLAKGPKGRSFAFSCGQLEDLFESNSASTKLWIMTSLKSFIRSGANR